jgi:hypothetical protein
MMNDPSSFYPPLFSLSQRKGNFIPALSVKKDFGTKLMDVESARQFQIEAEWVVARERSMPTSVKF